MGLALNVYASGGGVTNPGASAETVVYTTPTGAGTTNFVGMAVLT